MDKPSIPHLDELARAQREALEAALEDMVNSGFGDLESKLPADAATEPLPGEPPDFFLFLKAARTRRAGEIS